MDLELVEGWSKVFDLCFFDDKILDIFFQIRGFEFLLVICESSKDRNSVVFFFFISIFIWNILQKVSEGVIGESLVKVENFIFILVFVVQFGQEKSSFSFLGGFEERQFLFFENNFVVRFKEGDDRRFSISGLDIIDILVSYSLIVKFFQERLIIVIVNFECFQVIRESGDILVVIIVIKVYIVKYFFVLVVGNSYVDGLGESLFQVLDENIF